MLQSIIKLFIENKELVPSWGISLIIYLLLALVVVLIIKHIVKTIQEPEMLRAALFVGEKTKQAGAAVIREVSESTRSPIEHPKIKFAGTVMGILHSLVMSFLFLCLTLVTGYLYHVSEISMPWYKHLLVVMIMVVLSWLTLFFRADVDRQYLSAREQWSNRDQW
jgi:MFS family permease